MPAKRKASVLAETSENASIALPDITKLPPAVLSSPMSLRTGTPRKASSKAASAISSMDPAADDSGSDALTPVESDDAAPEEEEVKPKKKRKPRAPKPEPVYVIPDVVKKTTTFKGRLGYACLNTVLRKAKPDPIFCSRTLRIATIKEKGVEYMKSLGKQNMKDLATLIQWNEDNNIRFMRMSSEMFPFASHPDYGYDLEYAQEELTAAGDLAKKYGHRLTTHPGQFTQLGSPRDVVVKNAIRDLTYHCEMIDRMGLDKDSVMIIHGGGTFTDKPATLERIKANYQLLPENVKGRVVLENDEMCYNVDDLLPLCEELNIPLVFDYHHDWIFPSSQSPAELMPRILATWTKKGIKPKQHLSEPRPGAVTVMERRAHSDRCKNLPVDLPDDMDLMLEAKDKEQAVFEMYRMYDMYEPIYKNLRPPAEVETLHTNGRKSNKKKKAKAEEGEEEEGLEDPEAEPGTPAPKKRKTRNTPVKKEKEGDEENAEETKTPAKRKRTPKAKAVKAEDGEDAPPKKKRTPKKKATEDVETASAIVKTEDAPLAVDEGAAVLTGLPPLPEGFVPVDGEVHQPEAKVCEDVKMEET